MAQQFGENLLPGPVFVEAESERDKVGGAMNNDIDAANVDNNPAVQVPVQETFPQEAAENGQNIGNVEPVNNGDVPIADNNPVVPQDQIGNSVPIVSVDDSVNNPGDEVANLNVPAAVNPVDTYASNDIPANNLKTVNNNGNYGDAQQTQLGNQMIPQQNLGNMNAGNPGLPQIALQTNLGNSNVHEMNNEQPQHNLFQSLQNPEQNIVNEQPPQIQSQMVPQQNLGINNNLINAPQDQGLNQGIPQINDQNTGENNPLLNGNVYGNGINDQQLPINDQGAAAQENVPNVPGAVLPEAVKSNAELVGQVLDNEAWNGYDSRFAEQVVPADGAVLPQQNQVIPAAVMPQGSQDLLNNNINILPSENVENKPLENVQPVPLVPASGFGVQYAGGEQTELGVNKVITEVGEAPAVNENLQIPYQTGLDQSAVGVPSNQMPTQEGAGILNSQIAGEQTPNKDFEETNAQTDSAGIQMPGQMMPHRDNDGTNVQIPEQVRQDAVVSPGIQAPDHAVPGQGVIDGTGGQMPMQVVPQETVGSPNMQEPVQAMPDQGAPVGTGVQMPVQGVAPQVDTDEGAAPVQFRTTTSLSTEATAKWDTTELDRYLNDTDNAVAARQDADYDYKGDDDNADFDDGNDMDNGSLDDGDGFYGDDDDDDDADDDDLFDDMDADANDENLDAWRNWQTKDDDDDNDDVDHQDADNYRWPERASTEQSSTATVENGECMFQFKISSGKHLM